MRILSGGITASICFLFSVAAPSLRANDLYLCKQSASLAGEPYVGPINLAINSGGDHFHLQSLTAAYCYKTKSGVFGIVGTGTGLYDEGPGYTIHFTVTDAGEPGTNDFASYSITGPNGSV